MKYELKYYDNTKETLIRINNNLYEWKSSMDEVEVSQRWQWRELSDVSVAEGNADDMALGVINVRGWT